MKIEKFSKKILIKRAEIQCSAKCHRHANRLVSLRTTIIWLFLKLSSRPTSDWHHGICPDSLYCPEQLNNNGICYEPDINHGPDIFNHDTLSGYTDSTHHFFSDLASGISKSPAKSFTTGSGTGSAISTPVKSNIFQTPTKTPTNRVIFRTPDKPKTSPRRSDRICKIVMNSRDLPKNIKTRILNSRESSLVSSNKNGMSLHPEAVTF